MMDGQEIDGPDPARILVFQDPTLFPWRTVRQNVALGLETRGLLPAQGGASMTCSIRSGWTASTTHSRTNSPVVWRSVRRWHGLS